MALITPTFDKSNIYFDPLANYNLYGAWDFKESLSASGAASHAGGGTYQSVIMQTDALAVDFGKFYYAPYSAGGGDGWLTVGNLGLPLNPSKFGTLDATGILFQVNSITFMLVDQFADIDINASVLNINSSNVMNIAPVGSTGLNIGFSTLPVVFTSGVFTINADTNFTLNSADFINMTAVGNVLIQTSGGTQTFGNLFFPTFLYGISVSIFAQGQPCTVDSSLNLVLGGPASFIVNLGDDHVGALLNVNSQTINIGTVNSVTTIDATDVKMINMPATVGGEKIVMIDVVTGQLRISP